ncbi:MAG: hypothetical protein ACOCPX_03885 [Halapricum sp.]
MKRRYFLAGTASVAAILAGCSGGDTTPETTDDPTDTPGSDPTTTDPPTTEPPTTEPPTTEPPTTEPPDESAALVNGSFESGLDGWTVGKDLPEKPGESDEKVDSDVEVVSSQASDGESALEIFIDGSADDGTVWVQQEADLSEVSTLKVDGYSEQNSFNTVLEVSTYTGPVPEDGLVEADFTTDPSLWDHEGWKTYEYDVDHEGTGLVAVGLNIVWETSAAGILDNIRLE